MDRPDYEFWTNQPEYTLDEAAALCCNLAPRHYTSADGPLREMVYAMKRRLLAEVPFRDTSKVEIREAVYGGADTK